MDNHTELKDKIFSFGIYGRRIATLPHEVVTKASKMPWAEILSPEQITAFSNNFTLAPMRSKPPRDIPGDYVLRMNLHAWRAYLLGPDFITSNKYYFVLVDYLLANPGYIPWTPLRSKFGIDPKTMHYLCKRLARIGVMEEKKEGNETFIRLVDIRDRSKQHQEETPVLGNEAPADTSRLVFYKGIPVIYQIKHHAECSPDGLGARELSEMTGITPKNALKHLQSLCETFPDQFKMISSIEHGHTTFKAFSVENLAIRNSKKLEMMKNECPQEGDPVLSAKDRQEALWLIAKRRGHFILSKAIFEEIMRMTGYPYTIDRKNLIANAVAAGLKVFKLVDLPARRYVIALPSYDESVLKYYVVAHEAVKEENPFYRKVRRYFMNIGRFVITDNGYCDVPEVHSGILYGFLLGITEKHEWMQLDYQTVMKMDLTTFFKTTKIKQPCFLVKCVFELFKSNPGRFTVPAADLETLFVGSSDPKQLNPAVYTVLAEAGTVPMAAVMDAQPMDARETIREASNPFRYLKKFERLQASGLVEVRTDEEGRIAVRVVNRTAPVPPQCQLPIVPGLLAYNARSEFVSRMADATAEHFKEEAEAVLSTVFSRTEQKIMRKYLSRFMKEEKLTPSVPRLKRHERIGLGENHRELYLKIKKALVFQQKVDFRVLAGYENIDIEEVLDYMVQREIATGYRSLSSLTRVVIHNRFRLFVSPLPTATDEPISDRAYFEYIFPKIHSVVEAHGSIDLERLVGKLKYFEAFEVEAVLEQFGDKFSRREVDGFIFIGIANLWDPFSQ